MVMLDEILKKIFVVVCWRTAKAPRRTTKTALRDKGEGKRTKKLAQTGLAGYRTQDVQSEGRGRCHYGGSSDVNRYR